MSDDCHGQRLCRSHGRVRDSFDAMISWRKIRPTYPVSEAPWFGGHRRFLHHHIYENVDDGVRVASGVHYPQNYWQSDDDEYGGDESGGDDGMESENGTWNGGEGPKGCSTS